MARKGYSISKATASNWDRLNTGVRGRLTRGANKSRSERKVTASSYLSSQDATSLLDAVSQLPQPIPAIMRHLCEAKLKHSGLWEKPHVQHVLSTFPHSCPVDLTVPDDCWKQNEDTLGFVYQSLLTEGERNASGQYYTTRQVTETMLDALQLGAQQRFLDPCCGSGAFLTQVQTDDPTLLYGMDLDPVAVMLAQTNLLCRFPHVAFIPNICCSDFLERPLPWLDADGSPLHFDYIYTNPPWGSAKKKRYNIAGVTTRERSSLFVARSLICMKPCGRMHFLLPKSLLTVRGHRGLRHLLLSQTTIESIALYDHRFDGVFTDFFSICATNNPTAVQTYQVRTYASNFRRTPTAEELSNDTLPVSETSKLEAEILRKMEALRHDTLSHSQWAMGIVTGSNKKAILRRPTATSEPIYKGRHIQPFHIGQTPFHIRFQPAQFQQCAREELYRAPEKLIYRFIARYPIVAYDNRQRLCLNSANILIPSIPGIPIRCVASLLNSSLYRFYYTRHFSDIKVLKSNLQRLPFPLLSEAQLTQLLHLTDAILSDPSPALTAQLNHYVFTLFALSDEEQRYVTENEKA